MSCITFVALVIMVTKFHFNSVSSMEVFANDSGLIIYTDVTEADSCSEESTLPMTMNIGTTGFDSLYVCHNGYISLGSSPPPNLTSPGQFGQMDGSSASLIIAPALIKHLDEETHIVYSTHVIDLDELGTVLSISVSWSVFDIAERFERTVSCTITCSSANILVYGSECTLSFHYMDMSAILDPITNEYMRAGFFRQSDGKFKS